MKKFLFCVTIIFCTIAGVSGSAQTLRHRSVFSENFYNPATIDLKLSENKGVNVFTSHRFSPSLEQNHRNGSLNVDFQGRDSFGANLTAVYAIGYDLEMYSFYDLHNIYTSIGLQYNFAAGHYVSFGIRPVLCFAGVDYNRYFLPVQDGKTHETKFLGDFDFGVYYRYKNFHVAASIKNALADHTKDNLLSLPRGIYAELGYDFSLPQNCSIEPFLRYLYEYHRSNADIGFKVGLFGYADVKYFFRAYELRHFFAVTGYLPYNLVLGISSSVSHTNSDWALEVALGYRF